MSYTPPAIRNLSIFFSLSVFMLLIFARGLAWQYCRNYLNCPCRANHGLDCPKRGDDCRGGFRCPFHFPSVLGSCSDTRVYGIRLRRWKASDECEKQLVERSHTHLSYNVIMYLAPCTMMFDIRNHCSHCSQEWGIQVRAHCLGLRDSSRKSCRFIII
jgi:hypothetical protein